MTTQATMCDLHSGGQHRGNSLLNNSIASLLKALGSSFLSTKLIYEALRYIDTVASRAVSDSGPQKPLANPTSEYSSDKEIRA
jgi:hypothetical protein